ncbi:hypothetical protein JYB62_11975, partial [Algoriphagus lutimaris]|uniref:hypothetical protein n=1 Tax=Algoriphagus lutimaris TaxID=613197 RepID=UPI00196ACF69
MKMNSKYAYLFFDPEYLVDLLRAGGRFSITQSFLIPSAYSPQSEIVEFVEKSFPTLSEERYEICLKFRLPEDKSNLWFSLEEIISAHFYSKHRQEAVSEGVLHTLNVYGIPVLEPLDKNIEHVIEVYDSTIREHTARMINRAWFPDVKISNEFIYQLKLGYKYQQSPAPEQLPQIPSEYIWAHLVAYNPGLRKFEERPKVLWLQDIQEVIKRTDSSFKQELKSIGEKYNSKFSDILDSAEKGNGPSKWIVEKNKNEKSYFSELNRFLSHSAKQQNFFYTALLYLNWRESVLNHDYSGKLSDHKEVSAFLNLSKDNPIRKAIAEALFTIVFAGGPKVFQKALIEARKKILGIQEPNQPNIHKTPNSPIKPTTKPKGLKLFEDLKNLFGKIFGRRYDESSATKKKEIQKDIKKIGSTITKIKKGEFDYEQYLTLCLLFEIQAEPFDDYPKNEPDRSNTTDYPNEINKDTGNQSMVESATEEDSSDNKDKTATDSDQPDKKGDLIDDSTAPSDKTDAPPSDTENKHSEEDQSDINKDTAN